MQRISTIIKVNSSVSYWKKKILLQKGCIEILKLVTYFACARARVCLSKLCSQHGARTHNPEINSHMSYQMRQPGAPGTTVWTANFTSGILSKENNSK